MISETIAKRLHQLVVEGTECSCEGVDMITVVIVIGKAKNVDLGTGTSNVQDCLATGREGLFPKAIGRLKEIIKQNIVGAQTTYSQSSSLRSWRRVALTRPIRIAINLDTARAPIAEISILAKLLCSIALG